jgi:TatD DNase family protein
MQNTIVYRIRNTLYLNPTNRCTAACTFCRRVDDPVVRGYDLRLDREPSAPELIREIGDPTRFDEIVFCGYGEPTLRLDVIKDVAREIKAKGSEPRLRLNTNGHGNLIHNRNILPELAGLVDAISISLNAENARKYDAICRPAYGLRTYDAVLEFIREARKHIPEVTVTVVRLPEIDVGACERLAREVLDVAFRVRELDAVG